MTDTPYVALLLTAALGAIRWPKKRRWMALCIAGATLATLQRQTGVMIPIAITLALLFSHRRHWSRRDALGLVLLWAGCLAAITLPALTGIAPPTQATRLAAALSPNPIYVLGDLLYLPGMIGLGLILFLPGLALGARRRLKMDRTRLWIVALACWELILFWRLPSIFPGNVFLPLESKLWLAIEALALTVPLAFVWRWRDWWPVQTGRPGLILLCLTLGQFLPLALLPYLAFDRYYIPIVLLLLPLAARTASQTTRPVLAASLALLLALGAAGLYAADEQRYQVQQVALTQAACLAYQYASPLDVQAGYEANAVYAELPYYDRTGTVLGESPSSRSWFITDYGPTDPVIRLYFAPSNDPRPGYAYSSLLGSGKFVLVPGPRGATLNIEVPSVAPQCP